MSSSQPAFPGEVFFDSGPGQSGTLARSTINGPLFTELDMSLTKSIRFTERVRFQIRADAFNVLNLGQITSANTIGASGLNRVIQVAGRFEF